MFISASARANPADLLGFGSRAAAMGNAAVALVDDGAANYYNPAGLVRGRDLRIDLGYQAGVPRLAVDGQRQSVDGTHGFTAALVAPGRLLALRFAFGAALFLPDDRVTRVRALPYAQPRWVNYDNRTQRVFLAASLAIEILPGLSLGAGLAFMSRTQGTVALRGTIAVSDPDADSALVTAIDVDLVAVRYPQAGVQWQISPAVAVGVSYRHSFALKLDQAFSVRGDVGNPGLQPIVKDGRFEAHSVSTDSFQPWQLTVGGAVRLTRRLLVAFDALYARWSDFETPAAQIAVSLDVGPQLNPLVHLPTARSYPSPGFHDTLSPRLGLEWRALARERLALDLRAGYAYEPSPVPEQVGETSYADADKHRFSVGAGLSAMLPGGILPRPLALDAHLALSWLPTRANRKLDPTDPAGDFTAGGTYLEAGVTTRWRF